MSRKKTNKKTISKRVVQWKRPKLDVNERPDDAGVALSEIERIREKRGEATPEGVVNESKPKRAVLHRSFEWDNAVGGHKHRLLQARQLINAIEIVVIDEAPDGSAHEVTTVPAYVSMTDDSGDTGRQYHPIDEVMDDDAMREKLLQRAWREIQAWKAKYEHLQEFAQISKAIQAVSKKIAS